MKIFLGLGALALLIGGLMWKLDAGGTAKAEEISANTLFTVKRDDLVITVTENGYLKAKNSVKIKPEFNRSAEISWLIEEGEEVVEGDVLVEFDKTELEQQVADTENLLVQREMELEGAQANLEIQQRDNKAAKQKNELALEVKKKLLERYVDGDAPNERRKMELAAEKAKSQFERTQEQYESVPQLEEEGFLTRIEAEMERINLREAEIGAGNAAKDLELWLKYTYPMELAQKESDVRDAERELENTEAKATISLRDKEARLEQLKRHVTTTQTRLDELKEELGKMVIEAPSGGLVHYGDPERPWRRDEVKVGNRFRRGNVIATLPDLSEMQILVQVHEADIGLVAPDARVIVTVESLPGLSFEGKVTEVASVATSTGWGSESQTFKVEVTMDAADVEMKAGVTARAEIQVETVEDVLQVPIHAIVAEGGRHFCFVYADGEVSERTVEIGKNNAHFVSVLSGLEEDEKVLLYDPRQGGYSDGEAAEDGEDEPAGDGSMASGMAAMGGSN
jgi:RND family efflux transporter MFP subunit